MHGVVALRNVMLCLIIITELRIYDSIIKAFRCTKYIFTAENKQGRIVMHVNVALGNVNYSGVMHVHFS